MPTSITHGGCTVGKSLYNVHAICGKIRYLVILFGSIISWVNGGHIVASLINYLFQFDYAIHHTIHHACITQLVVSTHDKLKKTISIILHRRIIC